MLANTATRNRLNSHPPVGVGRVVLHGRQRGDILLFITDGLPYQTRRSHLQLGE
jgi:hypothetical protein